MTSNKELEARLKAIAEDFHLPGGGRKKLSKLVTEHMAWFDAAEQRGMSWPDMIRALTSAGVTSRGGKPLSVGTLSSTVWRKRAKVGEEMDRPGGEVTAIPPRSRSATEVRLPPAKAAQRERAAATSDTAGRLRSERDTVARSTASAKGGGQPNKDVLAFMDRARNVRRKSE